MPTFPISTAPTLSLHILAATTSAARLAPGNALALQAASLIDRITVVRKMALEQIAAFVRSASFQIRSTPTTPPPPSQAAEHRSAAAAEDDAALARFHHELAQRVQQLQLHGGSAHLNWLMDACASAHSSITSAVCVQNCTPATRRADEVVSMLDVCISLKQAAEDVDRQLRLLQATLLPAFSPLAKPSPCRLPTARRIGACVHGLAATLSAQYRPIAEAQASLTLAANRELLDASHGSSPSARFHLAVDGALLLSLLVLASATATFSPPTRSMGCATRRAYKLVSKYTSTSCRSSTRTKSRRSGAPGVAWAAPLHQLQRSLKQEHMGALFGELQGIQADGFSLIAACSRHDADQELRQVAERLWKRSKEAQACVWLLCSHLTAIFGALVALRLSLLG